jgi:esterase
MIIHANVLGEGKPLFVLHGFLGSGDNWKTFAKKWSLSGRQVHLLDARNHGKSFHNDTWDYPTMAADVIQYAESINISSFEVLGHSMGGKTAMYLALHYPTYIEKLVVADIAPKSYSSQHREILEALWELDQRRFASRNEAEDFLESLFESQQLRFFLLKNLERESTQELRVRCNIQRFMADQSTVTQELNPKAKSEVQSLFIRGLNSTYILDSDFERIHHQFPKSHIASLENAGHWLHAEQPEAFDRLVTTFLDL